MNALSSAGGDRCTLHSGRRRVRLRRERRGITLIELLTVVAIVGIVVALAVFRMNNYHDQVRLRQTAENLHQILSHAKLRSEKSGDTTIVKISMPSFAIYLDKNGDGKWATTDSLLLTDQALTNVVVSKPAAAPPEASVANPAAGLADGAGTCGTGVCCTQGSGTKPTWSDGYVNFCARTSPSLPPLAEDGAIYLGSSNSSVKEMWAIVMNRAKGVEPSLWTSDKAPTVAADWRKVR